MQVDPDECLPPGLEAIDWDKETLKAIDGRAAGAKYSKLSEGARQLLSEEKQCALFCKGKKCKYCTSESWTDEQKAIKGLFSHWVTDNILAMARPSTMGVEKHNIIDQFKSAGIKSVINLQKPGEHASCGGRLHDSGFSYNPQLFMDNDVFFYNFGWPDYGVASLITILDMVKVMQFAVSQGKVAVHCHAGLGRTGVLIACYLVFTNRMEPDEAIHYIRSKRPNAVQTRTQIQCIHEFSKYLKPLRIVFASCSSALKSVKSIEEDSKDSHEFTFCQFLNRQRHMLHGFEARRLKYLPKIIYVVFERLLELSGRQNVISRSSTPSSGASRKLNGKDPETNSLSSYSSRNNLLVPPSDSVHKSHSMSDLTKHQNALSLTHSSSQQQLHVNEKNSTKTEHNSIRYLASQIEHLGDEGRPGETTDDSDEGSSQPGVGGIGLTSSTVVVETLASGEFNADIMEKVRQYQCNLNDSIEAWKDISSETDPNVLAALLWDWLNHLKEPALRSQDLAVLLDHVDDPETGVHRLEKGIRYSLEYMMKVLVHLQPLTDELEDRLFETLLSHLTHKVVRHDAALSPLATTPSHWTDIKSSSAKKLFHFFYRFLDIVQEKINQPASQKSTNGFPNK